MDRFIATPNISVQTQHIDLKSNMDRFIEKLAFKHHGPIFYLKSNMDRFIAAAREENFVNI